MHLVNGICVCTFRCVYSAAVWYYHHLAGVMDVVMITEDQDTVARYSCLNSGVYVITVQVRMGRKHYGHNRFSRSDQVFFSHCLASC